MTFLRTDNRASDELRPVKITPNFLRNAEGSALIEMGNTRVICAASVEDKLPPHLRNQRTEGWVTAEYGMLPRSTHTRSAREVGRGGPSGRTHEIQRLIGRSLRAISNRRVLGERTITLDCDVLQADGGTRCAAITGACVALAIALAKLMREGLLKRWPMRETVAAVSVGICAGQPVLDLAYAEDSEADVDCNVVGTASGNFVEIQGTAERRPFTQPQLLELLALAREGLGQLRTAQEKVLLPALEGLHLPGFAGRD